MTDGQAGNSPGSIDDLAQFLVDTPEADSEPTNEEEGQTSDEPSSEDNSDESNDEDAPADEDDESSEEPEPTSDLKFKVPVKGEDGTESIVEVDQKELIAGYPRHADYTRKTQALGEREREITQVVSQKLQEGQNYYMQQAQMAQAAVRQLAGLRSPEEMAHLAQTDPASWVQEQQRERAITGVLAQLEQGVKRERQQTQAQMAEATQKQISQAWGVLGQKGIDKAQLVKIYETVTEKYGVPPEHLAKVTDPTLVLMMRDAAAYQGLKDKKAQVVQKAQVAPKMPAARQSVPKQEKQDKALNAKFASGRAKLKDLAAYLANN
jgi:hypothetical protein